MILKGLIIYSYQQKEILKEYIFNEIGLNVVLGEKKEEGQETNGVGKTTMVESLDYLLGGTCPNDFIGKPILTEKDILIALEIKTDYGKLYLARLLNQPQKGFILNEESISFNLNYWFVKETDEEFKKYVNNVVIGLEAEEPSFSALREYIFRDEKEGFVKTGLPDRTAISEATHQAFLFGLPYNFEKEIAKLKKQQKENNQKLSIINSLKDEISELKLLERKLLKEIKELDDVIQKVKLSQKLSKDADNYQIIKSQYNEIQTSLFELKHIRKQYHNNINDLQSRLDEIKAINDIEPFYEQLIGYFPERVKKNQEEIQQFYSFMVENRGKYFSHKISEIDYQIEQEQKKVEELNKLLKRYSQSFKNTDFISDITKVSEDKNIKYEELAQIRVKINLYQEKTSVTAAINRIKQEILRQIDIKLDIFKSYENDISEIKELFNSLVHEAYDETGVFDIELVNDIALNIPTGRVKINCTIDDEKSHGRLHMKINMFDLTWFLYGLEKKRNLTFLVHDGSYSKPNGNAKFRLLKYIDAELKSRGKGQYFVTINVNELEGHQITDLYSNKNVVMKLIRTEDNKERFFGFRYTT